MHLENPYSNPGEGFDVPSTNSMSADKHKWDRGFGRDVIEDGWAGLGTIHSKQVDLVAAVVYGSRRELWLDGHGNAACTSP